MRLKYQIGTAEPKGVIGSRACQSNDLEVAMSMTRQYSRSQHVKVAWLREMMSDGTLGPIIAQYSKGKPVVEG